MSFTKDEIRRMARATADYMVEEGYTREEILSELGQGAFSKDFTQEEFEKILDDAIANPVDVKELYAQSLKKRPLLDALEARKKTFPGGIELMREGEYGAKDPE